VRLRVDQGGRAEDVDALVRPEVRGASSIVAPRTAMRPAGKARRPRRPGQRAASRRGGREGIAGWTADEQECTGAQARWRIMWLTNDGRQRALFEALRKLESGKTGNVGLKWFEILTMPGVAQSLMSLLLRGEFR
jgi:hypothetical protein